MIFKKEYPPSEDELSVLKSGEEWTAEKEKQIALRVIYYYLIIHFY